MSSMIELRSVAEKYLAIQPSSNLYFLMDHSGLPGLHRRLDQCSAKWLSLFDCTREQSALSVAPFLVLAVSDGCLRLPGSFFDWASENGTHTSSIIMLSSPQHIELVKKRLTARLEVKLTENMEALLRFFDPRVFESLTTVLSLEQAERFFCVADHWKYIDRTGKLIGFSAKFMDQDEAPQDFSLTQQQEFELVEACEPDQVLTLLRENAPKLLEKVRLQDRYEFVSRHIVIAKREGLDSVSKFSIYMLLVLSKGDDFINDPMREPWIRKIKEDNFEFADDEDGNDE